MKTDWFFIYMWSEDEVLELMQILIEWDYGCDEDLNNFKENTNLPDHQVLPRKANQQKQPIKDVLLLFQH